MVQVQYKDIILVDGDSDGVFNIHDSQDSVLDLSGNPLTISQALAKHSELQDTFYFVDSEGKWLGEQNSKGVGMAFAPPGASIVPSGVSTSPITHPNYKMKGALALVAGAIWLGWEILTNPDEELVPELTPGVDVIPEERYFTIYAVSGSDDSEDGDDGVQEIEIVVEEGDAEVREEVEVLLQEAQELSPVAFAKAVEEYESAIEGPIRTTWDWSGVMANLTTRHFVMNGKQEDLSYARLKEIAARLGELTGQMLGAVAIFYEKAIQIYKSLGETEAELRARNGLLRVDPTGALRIGFAIQTLEALETAQSLVVGESALDGSLEPGQADQALQVWGTDQPIEE